jgi:hypothetical protein
MINIARGYELSTTQAQARSFNPEASVRFPEPAIEYARVAPIVMGRRNNAPNAALEAVAAAPQPSLRLSFRLIRKAAANHMRLRTFRLDNTAATRIRVRPVE